MPIVEDNRRTDVARLIRMVEADFREMPSMRLTHAQAQRLWNLSQPDCAQVLGYLVSTGRLVRDRAGQYCSPLASY